MAAWYWFVIAGVAVLVIGGTIYVLTKGGDEEEAAAMEDKDMGVIDERSLEELAKDGLMVPVDKSVHFGAPEDTSGERVWVSRDTCEDTAKIGEKKPEEKKEGEKDEKKDEDKADEKSLQTDLPDEKDAEKSTEDEEKWDAMAAMRWWTVTGLAEGDCEIHLMEVAKDDAEDADFDGEDVEYTAIKVTVGEAKEEKKEGDDKDEEKEEDE